MSAVQLRPWPPSNYTHPVGRSSDPGHFANPFSIALLRREHKFFAVSGRWEVTRSISSRGNRALLVFCNVTEKPYTLPRAPRRKSFFRCFVLWLVICVALIWSLAALTLLAARWIDPPTTAVHIQRRLQAWIHHTPYHQRYKFIPLSQISPDLQHAVLAAEDARFYQHHGFDWHAIQLAAEEDMEGGRMRGGSTITQQLVKNLFFGTGRSFLRKGAEFTLVPIAEVALGK